MEKPVLNYASPTLTPHRRLGLRGTNGPTWLISLSFLLGMGIAMNSAVFVADSFEGHRNLEDIGPAVMWESSIAIIGTLVLGSAFAIGLRTRQRRVGRQRIFLPFFFGVGLGLFLWAAVHFGDDASTSESQPTELLLIIVPVAFVVIGAMIPAWVIYKFKRRCREERRSSQHR